jgi:uncharacterized membrane protein YhiD involved in acid resistance
MTWRGEERGSIETTFGLPLTGGVGIDCGCVRLVVALVLLVLMLAVLVLVLVVLVVHVRAARRVGGGWGHCEGSVPG